MAECEIECGCHIGLAKLNCALIIFDRILVPGQRLQGFGVCEVPARVLRIDGDDTLRILQ